MNINKILQSLFGNKSTRDMKLIQPLVEKVKATYEEIKPLSNDELRERTRQIQAQVQDAAKEQKRLLMNANRFLVRLTNLKKKCSTFMKMP